jgi:hypothetical protein
MKKTILYLFAIACSFNAYSLSITREISNSVIGNNESTNVTLTITKGGIEGLAKLVEQIPEGFTALVVTKSGGKVKLTDNGQLKIRWFTLPANDKIIIEYRLDHLGSTSGQAEIVGSFTYMKDEAQQKYSIDATTITVGKGSGNSSVAAVKKAVVKEKVAVKEKVVVKKKPIIEEKVVEEEIVVAEKTAVPADPPVAKNNVVYKVQVGAYSNEKSMSIFKGLPDVHFKMVNGLYKYYTGNLKTESDARKLIAKAEAKGFEGAFLVKE